jgi:hypothetical protein
MSKKLIIAMIITVLCISLFFIGCNSTKVQNQTKGGLKINNWSSGIGSVNENDLDKSVFSYSINLINENEKTVFIKSIQPIVNEKIINKILSEKTIVTLNKDIKSNETIEITGKIIVDTKGLAKSDIIKFEPFITDIKISTDEIVSLKR